MERAAALVAGSCDRSAGHDLGENVLDRQVQHDEGGDVEDVPIVDIEGRAREQAPLEANTTAFATLMRCGVFLRPEVCWRTVLGTQQVWTGCGTQMM